jgi:phosphoenolpyruvate synthase/pyruvate phosphate dikinase
MRLGDEAAEAKEEKPETSSKKVKAVAVPMPSDIVHYQLICADGTILNEGDWVTLDGSAGVVYAGEVPMVEPTRDEHYETVLRWADKYKRMQVLANAENPTDVKTAFGLGAEGTEN